ncbi:MAG: hypothetical protein K6F19_00380 [Oscillospiraceae bacterium]|nr:hypothetical protein [Oscillospiraceae bacterium]
MRTRLLPILCVLALLLSACTADGKPSAATASVPVSGPRTRPPPRPRRLRSLRRTAPAA